jgi:hypothetical protein
MKWYVKRGRMYKSVNGTARAHLYYWVRHNGVRSFSAGYYGYGREIEFMPHFSTVQQAKAYCEKTDANAFIIEEVTA